MLSNYAMFYQINSCAIPKFFLNTFKNPTHNYRKRFARTNYSILPFKLNKCKYRISIRGPNLWKNIPKNTEKSDKRPISLKP